MTQGEVPLPGANAVFKVRRYAPTYAGLSGQDLSPKGVIELPPPSCCVDIRGDANGDGNDANILDLTFMVDFLFRESGDPGEGFQ